MKNKIEISIKQLNKLEIAIRKSIENNKKIHTLLMNALIPLRDERYKQTGISSDKFGLEGK
jgi:hypothetical protein